MARFLWVCLAGALGTGARFLVVAGALRALGPAFPYGTLVVNVVGSFLMGVIVQLASSTHWISPDLRVILATGVMGGFTTYSSFNNETLAYLRAGQWTIGGLNVGATLLLCLAAGVAGAAGGRWLAGQ